jgi:aminoglycoside 6-adenylyltransferase
MSAQLFEKAVTWAHTEEIIRVMIIEGSRARNDHAVDRFSDYDLNLYVTDVAQYTDDDTWIEQIGPIWAMEKETDPDGGLDQSGLTPPA